MDQYKLISKKGDGTFSQVFMAQSVKTGKYVAIKCMKKKYDSRERVQKLKQIQALKLLSPHDNIIKLIEVLYDQPIGKLALVFELMDMNLYQCLVKRKNLAPAKAKYYMFELLKSIIYIHEKGIFHRDIKPENVLITGDSIKLADFGSCKGIYGKQPFTEYISTRWYRAPECLMTDGYYDQKMDIWGYGCVLFQMMAKYPLFNGKNEIDQIHKINKILGPPNNQLLQRFKSRATHLKPNDWNFPNKPGSGIQSLISSKQLVNLLNQLLAYDPQKRITASQAIQHDYFYQIHEAVNNKFRSTMFGMPTSFTSGKSNDSDQGRIGRTPKKNVLQQPKGSKGYKKNEQQTSFPPINHQLKVDFKLNLYGSTVKPDQNMFKRPHGHIRKDEYAPYKKKY